MIRVRQVKESDGWNPQFMFFNTEIAYYSVHYDMLIRAYSCTRAKVRRYIEICVLCTCRDMCISIHITR